MKVFWTLEAEKTFEQNIAYLEQEWNSKVIANFIDRTEQAIAAIGKNPYLFPVLNKKKSIHRCLIVKQITLYYRIHESRIDLLTFWNNYQHPEKLKL